MGSSFAMGMHVPAEKTFTALLPEALSRRTGRKVEVFNEGMHTGFAGRVALSLNDALAVKPDMILWLLTMHDVKGASVIVPESVAVQAKSPGAASIGPKSPFSVFRTSLPSIRRSMRCGNCGIERRNHLCCSTIFMGVKA